MRKFQYARWAFIRFKPNTSVSFSSSQTNYTHLCKTMRIFLILALSACVCSGTKPARRAIDEIDPSAFGIEYGHYLKEVSKALESDPDFKEKLDQINRSDVDSIAQQLEFASHHVRTKLDELKRHEIQRLRDLIREKKLELDESSVDHLYPTETFDSDDLKRLMNRTSTTVIKFVKERQAEFKKYKMDKEYKKRLRIARASEEDRKRIEKEYREKEAKRRKHAAVHEPGHKAQLDEVWEKQDQMQQKFDPKIFFMLHDLDSNRFLDEIEVKTLFIKELDKLYAEGTLDEDTALSRMEDMERMMESVFNQTDTNKDRLISLQELLDLVKSAEFEKDEGWKGVDEEQIFTDEEYEAYVEEQKKLNEMNETKNKQESGKKKS